MKSEGSSLFFYFYVGSRGQSLPAEPSHRPGRKIFFFQMPFGDVGAWRTRVLLQFLSVNPQYLFSDTPIEAE